MILRTSKTPESVLEELRLSILPGFRHKEFSFVLSRLFTKKEKANLSDCTVGEIMGSRFWLMYSTERDRGRFFWDQFVFSGKVAEKKGKTIIRGSFVPQPCAYRFFLYFWAFSLAFALIVILFSREKEPMDVVLISPLFLLLAEALIGMLYLLLMRLFQRTEIRIAKDLLRRIASGAPSP